MPVVELVDGHPVPAVGLVDLGGEVLDVAHVLGIAALLRGVLLMLASQGVERLEVVVGVGDEILDDLRFEVELGIDLHHFVDLLLEMGLILGRGGLLRGGDLLDVMVGDGVCQALELLAEAGKKLQVSLAALDLLVLDDTVEAFAGIEQALGHVDMGVGDEAEAVEDILHAGLGLLDALGDLDLLLAGEEGNLSHLLEVHADGIVEDVEAAVGLLFLVLFLLVLVVIFLLLDLLDAVHLGGVDDVDLDGTELGEDGVDGLGIVHPLGEMFVEILESDVALFLGKLQEFADLFLEEFLSFGGIGRGLA